VPTYEYACDQCQRTFEVRQRISEPPLTSCQHCGGSVRRLLAPAAFILKGGGWYVTDYPSQARKQAVEAEKKATEPAASSSGPASSSPSPAPSSGGDGAPSAAPKASATASPTP
jgi:putative FmdB family regulatory protein